MHKQVIQNAPTKTYRQVASEVGYSRLFTLGLIPSFNRNLLLGLAYAPVLIGNTSTPVALIYALGGILLSHPFEVARVIIQHGGASQGRFGDSLNILKSLWRSEGLAGLYRGVTPRTLNLLPAVITVSQMSRKNALVE